jgi:lipid-A-disaccharide synthase-like uncharacterized protein
MGVFSKIFIFINRLFGALSVFGGIYALAYAIVLFIRAEDVVGVCKLAIFGIVLIAAGFLYLRAPLFRRQTQRGRLG